jgi:hypothetical protein
VSRGSRAVLYFFFAVVSLLLGASAMFTGIPIAYVGELGNQPLLAVYGWLIVLVAIVAPIMFVGAAFYALLFGRDA